jgi:hypothetical protein
MAVIQYTGLVSGMQGKLNGSVLSRGRAGQLIYKSPVQRKEPTAAQLSVRSAFSAIAAFWRALTPTEREDWITIADANPLPNRFGDPMIVSGYSYFQRMLSMGSPFLSPASLAPDLSADSVYEFSTVSAACDIELTDEGYLLTNVEALGESLNDSPAANQWNLYISLPVPDFGLPYFKTWYLIGQGTFSPGLGSAAALNFDVASVLLSTGFRSFDGAKHLLKGICFIPDQGGVSVEQIWDFVPVWAPPFVFPLYELYAPGTFTIYRWDAGEFDLFQIVYVTSDGFDVEGNYMINFEWAPAQPTTAPATVWGDLINVGIVFLSSGPGALFAATTPEDPSLWKTAYDAEFPASANSPEGWFIPIRTRLYHIPTGSYSEWQEEFIPVIQGV